MRVTPCEAGTKPGVMSLVRKEERGLEERLEACERLLAKRDSDVSRLREEKLKAEAEADTALHTLRQLQVLS